MIAKQQQKKRSVSPTLRSLTLSLAHTIHMGPPTPLHRAELERERAALLRSIAKLEESNAALAAAVAAGEDDDGCLKQSIGENIVVLARQKARAAALADEVARAGGGKEEGAAGGEGVWL